MAMIASLHVQDSVPPQEELVANAEPTEFNIFRDYFGLHTIVKSIAAENAPEESIETEEISTESRPRRDSLGSAASEFSSNSLESVEVADICFNYNQEVRAMQAFSEIDMEQLSPLGVTFEAGAGSHTNIPPSLYLNHTKLTTLNVSPQVKKPQV